MSLEVGFWAVIWAAPLSSYDSLYEGQEERPYVICLFVFTLDSLVL